MRNIFLILLLVLPAVIFTVDNGYGMLARADDDVEDESVDVEGEGEGDNESDDVAVTDEGEEDEQKTTASPYADTTILFVKPIAPQDSQLEIPAGRLVEFLVGFKNKGKQDFVLESLEASFRYPMDFNFYIQNFSAIGYNRLVKPGHEATLSYSFLPSEAFAGRPMGLNVNLNYRDAGEVVYNEAVYNETVQIVEIEEGLDGETFFLYVFLAAGVVLLLVIGQQFLGSLGRKRIIGRKPVVETGTSNPNNVDYDWLPRETLQSLNKKNAEKLKQSPRSNKQSHKAANKQQSPQQRKVKRTAGTNRE